MEGKQLVFYVCVFYVLLLA